MIRFDSVSKQYPGTARPALNAVSFEVLRGEFVFLVGASGSGKTSCLRMILKEEKPTRGKIHVLGQDLGTISSRKAPYFRRNIGVVFQDFRLLNNKNVFANVAFSLQVIGKSKGFIQEAVPDVLATVGLEGKGQRMPHELSGGEQQRVAIARAVVNKPQVLLADEPTGNLDPATSAGIMAVLERINAGGTTVLMATHEAGIVDQMQRRVIELVNGEIVRDERHGGYGLTAAVPVVKPEQRRPAVVDVEPEATPAPAAVIAARTASVPRQAPSHTASMPVVSHGAQRDVPRTAPPQSPPVDGAPAAGSAERQTPSATPNDDLPDQLSLAEKLGLRAPGSTDDLIGEQNVGPVK
jgi:cell division transport system ATP-binding protein